MNESKVVYILTNPAMPGLVKIGMAENLEEVSSLSRHSDVPAPYEVHYVCKVSKDPAEVISVLHGVFDEFRVSPQKDFFKVMPEKVEMILKLVELKTSSGRAKRGKQKPPFTFSSVGIPEGSIIYFSLNTDITAKVVGDRKVEFEGEVTWLSTAAAKVLTRDHGWTYSAVQGPAYWLYENETLLERRRRLENKQKHML